MFRRALAVALAVSVFAVPGSAQDMSLEEVLERHYAAIGGLAAWKDLESVRMNGIMRMPAQGIEAPFTMRLKRPDKYRLEFTVQGMTGIHAYDGATAWALLPFMGQTDPQEVPEAMANDIKNQADIDGPLIGYREDGHQLELVGLEETAGTKAYKIKVTRASGDVEYHYLDAEHFVPIKSETTQHQMGQAMQVETILSDYKPVDGLMFPHSLEVQPLGQMISLEQIELNVPVEDSQFTMPETGSGGQP